MHEMIQKAREFSLKHHSTQLYGKLYPYYKHLEDVYEVLIRFGFNETEHLDILTASFLHDILEDTEASYNDIKKAFNTNVAEIVYCMTDELGRTRKEKKEKTYPKIRSNPQSIILKVADRIANVEFSATQDTDHNKMYMKEYADFEHHLRIFKQIPEMWEHLKTIININKTENQ